MKNVVILCLFVRLQNPIERNSILNRCKLFSKQNLRLKIHKLNNDILTFKVRFENNLHSPIMKVLYCAIDFCKKRNEERMKMFLSEHAKTETRIEVIIKMENEFKLNVIHFACPNPTQICALRIDLLLDKKTVENQDWDTGLQAAGPQERWAFGPSWAGAAGPLAHQAMGLLIVKPLLYSFRLMWLKRVIPFSLKCLFIILCQRII